MLNEQQATAVARKAFPDARIVKPVIYKGKYLFQIYWSTDPNEEDMDPYFTVDQQTGKFAEFSMITDGNPNEIAALYGK